MRLIDANALLRHKRKMSGADFGGEFWDEAVLTSDIKNATTVDAVEVVRCRECKHCDPENYHCDHPMSTAAPLIRKPDDFCSYGERKEGDGNGRRGERMTYEEAIKILTELKPIPIDGFKIIAEAYDLAIDALEKQIPKKPLHMHKNYYCPICKEDGWMLWDDAIPNDMDKYCGICGQAIDWRMTNEKSSK